jgi:hypothetical protein
MPVIGPAGNVMLPCPTAAGLSLVVNADRAAYRDLDVLVAGVERAWRELGGEAETADNSPAVSPPAPAAPPTNRGAPAPARL